MAKKKLESIEEEIMGVEENLEEEVADPSPKEKKVTKAEQVAQEVAAIEFTDAIFYGEGPWPLLSRAAAIEAGMTRYYTGVPCQNGHDAPRKTKSAACLVCARIRLRERHKTRMQNDADYRAKHNEKAKARRAAKKSVAATA